MGHCGDGCAGGFHGGARYFDRECCSPAHCRQPGRQYRPGNLGTHQLSHIERDRPAFGSLGIQRNWAQDLFPDVHC
jgi:hypothetical protein